MAKRDATNSKTIEEEATLTGAQLQAIRDHLKMDRYEFGRMLGYGGADLTVFTQILRLETGEREIKPWIALLCLAILDGWRPITYRWGEEAKEPFRQRRKSVIGK